MPVFTVYRLTLLAAACASLSACSSINNVTGRISGVISPYKVEVVQGNFVSKEQKESLQMGMPRAQVRDVLGAPLVTSAFHADRWEYVFTIQRQGQESQQRKLAVFFKGDELSKVESDELISEQEFVNSLSAGRSLGKVPLLEVPPEVLREFSLQNTSSSTAQARPNLAAGAALATYPPLEAAGVVTSAWDASTQRAVAASVASRSANAPAASAAPFLSAQNQQPVPTTAPATAVPPVPTPAPRPATTAPAPAPVPVTAPASLAVASASVPAPVSSPAVAAAPVISAATTPAPALRPVVPAPAPVAAPANTATAITPVAPVVAQAPVPSPRPVAATPTPAANAPAPTPALTTSASTLADADPEITTLLNRWTLDWQSRNAAAFFGHYVPEFKGTADTRTQWEALRRTRIEGRSRISLAALDVRARMVSLTEARLVFRQVYESDAFYEVGTKAMFLVKRDGRWLIEREFFTPAQ
jgi:outer membrane protein assembly factor BamE